MPCVIFTENLSSTPPSFSKLSSKLNKYAFLLDFVKKVIYNNNTNFTRYKFPKGELI